MSGQLAPRETPPDPPGRPKTDCVFRVAEVQFTGTPVIFERRRQAASVCAADCRPNQRSRNQVQVPLGPVPRPSDCRAVAHAVKEGPRQYPHAARPSTPSLRLSESRLVRATPSHDSSNPGSVASVRLSAAVLTAAGHRRALRSESSRTESSRSESSRSSRRCGLRRGLLLRLRLVPSAASLCRFPTGRRGRVVTRSGADES